MKLTKKLSLRFLALALACLALIGAYQVYLRYSGNFHEVVAGEFYRARQPAKGDLAVLVETHGIKTVLNLRGRHPGAEWYEAEKREAAAAGIQLIDFRMSDGKHMTPPEAMKLIQVMQDAPKPLLVHCRAGADRTGLASALYLAAVKKDTEFNAEMQMTLLYGHLSLWFTRPYAMNTTFEDMEPLLGYHDS